ncbi:MAG: hypothetical protein NE330_01005 [Lentisphaeraceae bacterium]|nr:hypothetical protein [Lentisphaeraceae bacterium]
MKIVGKLESLLSVFESYYESQVFDGMKLEGLIKDLRSVFSKKKPFIKVLSLCDQILKDTENIDLDLVMELVFLLKGLVLSLSVEEEHVLSSIVHADDQIIDKGEDWFLLQPLVKALELKGSGRLRLLEESVAFGTYKNRFLMPYIAQAAFDSYGPVSELILREMLPYFGLSGAMCLSKSIEFNGTASEERVIIYLLSELPYKSRNELLERAFQSANTKSLQYVLSHVKYESWMFLPLTELKVQKKGALRKLVEQLLANEIE